MTRATHQAVARTLVALVSFVGTGAGMSAEGASRSPSRPAPSAVAKTTATKSASKPTTTGASSAKKASTKASSKSKYSRSRSAARKARLARARALQRQRELREVQTPRYQVATDGNLVPDPRAEAAIIYNPATHEVLWEENANNPRSIASITKVMTAVVFLEHEFDLGREVVVERTDVRGASVTYLRGGERLTVDSLVHLLLIASDNAAARVLARVSPWGSQGFVGQMNAKAHELGLTNTHYADPSGLDAANVSSAYDMARLIAFAASDERIAPIMRKADHRLTTSRRTITVHNTNRLVGSDLDVRGGKTGFISRSGYCLATLLRLPQTDEEVAVVVLGARSNAARFWETRHLFNWLTSRVQPGSARALEQ